MSGADSTSVLPMPTWQPVIVIQRRHDTLKTGAPSCLYYTHVVSFSRQSSCCLCCAGIGLRGQTGALNGEWRAYGGDAGHTRYSPLDQIDATNFSKLTIAWRFKTDHLGPRPEFMFESTPVMANGVLYSTAGSRRAVVALDPETGEELWMHSEREGPRGTAAPRQLSGRGLAYWTDGKEERILYVTPGYQLVASEREDGHAHSGLRR